MLPSRMFVAVCALALASVSGGACGMTESTGKPVSCRVSGADKALAEAGGPSTLCELIERAAKTQAPGASFDVNVRAPTVYSLAAEIRLADGRVLPELKMAVSDRRIDRGSVERYAAAIADAAAKASRP